MTWNPSRFERWHDCDDKSSTGVAHIQTDAGPAYLKALGNAEGPHALVREWVGMSVARWFGLTTFDFAQMEIESGFDIPLGNGKVAEPGPAFVTRKESGRPWRGIAEQLQSLVNPEHVTGLVIVDTWLLNADRYPPPGNARRPNYANVFLSIERLKGHESRLIAMDFSDCLKPPITLSPKIAGIAHTKDDRLYGLFPDFEEFLLPSAYQSGLTRLREANESAFQPMMRQLPDEWEVTDDLRAALVRFLVQRAAYLVENLPHTLGEYVHMRGKAGL